VAGSIILRPVIVATKIFVPVRLKVKSEMLGLPLSSMVLGADVHVSMTVRLLEPSDDTHTWHSGAVVANEFCVPPTTEIEAAISPPSPDNHHVRRVMEQSYFDPSKRQVEINRYWMVVDNRTIGDQHVMNH
jgi:hypothetical protein